MQLMLSMRNMQIIQNEQIMQAMPISLNIPNSNRNLFIKHEKKP